MKMAVYAPNQSMLPVLLVPECMRPALEVERESGARECLGVVDLDESLMALVCVPTAGGADEAVMHYMVGSKVVARQIKALIRSRAESTTRVAEFG